MAWLTYIVKWSPQVSLTSNLSHSYRKNVFFSPYDNNFQDLFFFNFEICHAAGLTRVNRLYVTYSLLTYLRTGSLYLWTPSFNPSISHPLPLVTTNLLSFSMSLGDFFLEAEGERFVFDFTYKEDHTIFVLWLLSLNIVPPGSSDVPSGRISFFMAE